MLQAIGGLLRGPCVGGSEFELHAYQKDFLDNLANARGLDGAAAALQEIVDRAMSDDSVRKAIFENFHCVHCGSVSPAQWISARKGKKEAYDLALTRPAVAFLGKAMLVQVEKVGEPPVRQVVPGPLRADANKAARCCIDWAIKNYGALADGKINGESKFELHAYQKDFLDNMADARGLDGAAAALQAIVDRAMSDDSVRKAIFENFHCVHCGSVSPAQWISARKGKKDSYNLVLTRPAIDFLCKAMLVQVEKVGEPPVRQVVPGPLKADWNKAARCCIDWAIKDYGVLADGKMKRSLAAGETEPPLNKRKLE
jgi:hypothetical protein